MANWTRATLGRLAGFRFEVIGLLFLAVVVLARGIDKAPLLDWDEATYAEVAHEAVANGTYLNLTWNGQPYLKKPPLLFWMVAASFKSFGESEFAARLPSVLMGLGTLLLAYAMVAESFGRLGGLLAGVLPLSFYFFVARGGRECATDAPLVFFSSLAIFALARARRSRKWLALSGVACGLAILSKGLAGAIALSVVLLSLLALPAFSTLGVTGLVSILGPAIAVAAPWFVYQAAHNGELFWSTYVEQETLMRLATHLEAHRRSAGFTLRIFCQETAHFWPLVLPFAGLCVAHMRRGIGQLLRRIPAPVAVWSLWLALALGSACAVQTKLAWYVLPALIPLALLAASVPAAALKQDGAGRLYCRPLGGIALAILGLTTVPTWSRIDAAFMVQRERSTPSFEMAMRARALAAVLGRGELYFAGPSLPTLVYYSGMRCHFVSPSDPDFELTDLGGNPISVSYHELVLRDPAGKVTAVDNLDQEWKRSGPGSSRAEAGEVGSNTPPPEVRPTPD